MSGGPSIWQQIFDFTDYGELLALVHNSLIAGAVLGIVGGLISVFVMMRDLPFAVHGISELSFAGAAGFLLLGRERRRRLDHRLDRRRAADRRARHPGP